MRYMLTLVTIICLCFLLTACRRKTDTVVLVTEKGFFAKGTVRFARGSDGKYAPDALQPGTIVILRVDTTILGESCQKGMVYLITKDNKFENIGKADLNKTDDELAAEYLKSDSREGQPSQKTPSSSPQSKAIGDQKSDQQDKEGGPSTPSEQIAVSIRTTGAKIARTNPRLIKASSPAIVKFRIYSGLLLEYPTSEVTDEFPPEGMKWVIVTIELDPIQEEITLPTTQICLVDDLKRKYQLISSSPGGPDSEPFKDYRKRVKQQVGPTKIGFTHTTVTKRNLLFAVSVNAKGLILEL